MQLTSSALMRSGQEDLQNGQYLDAINKFFEAGQQAVKSKAKEAGIELCTDTEYNIFIYNMLLNGDQSPRPTTFAMGGTPFINREKDLTRMEDGQTWAEEFVKKNVQEMIYSLNEVNAGDLSKDEFTRICDKIASLSST
uniref:Uncharacterized protein n=1 Tax=Ditylenchus dipsaci TaxID=166011 RepID=A0A915D626_9BILA